jgi:hypothetical protein
MHRIFVVREANILTLSLRLHLSMTCVQQSYGMNIMMLFLQKKQDMNVIISKKIFSTAIEN